ncbi:MBG domain-containing protein [Silvibacterium dinghuense]|uniref:MBG domain-containing protein n=1 Tax=Silvibacterium dinghuense TaxID=1560006 RepID=A0A4Q1SBP4_9BACT|nr:MBG domain-containing protein [Silvibacterium dinghuense]RXS94250.1 hypothetical protein ESZ00_14185 [Silvibacterium dinghuense]GGH17440.1 hypothetical protein GCM10011586_39960 [Silvibacterium dinghuense]
MKLRFLALLSAVLRTLLLASASLFLPLAALAQTSGDTTSGFEPGLIHYFAGDPSNSNASFSDGSLPTQVPLGSVVATATDSHGNVYVAISTSLFVIYGGNTIPQALKSVAADPETGRIYQVAGFGVTSCGACEGQPLSQVNISNIAGLVIDSQDNLYYSDDESQDVGTVDVVRKVDATTSIVTTVAGQWGVNNSSFSSNIGNGGPATSAVLYYPEDIKLDPWGNLYIDDNFDDEVRVVYQGSEPPPALAAEGVSVTSAQKGYIFNLAGQAAYYCTTLGSCGDDGLATSAGLGAETSIGVDAGGNVYIADGMTSSAGANVSYIRMVYAGVSAPAALNQYLNPGGGDSGAPQSGYLYPITGSGANPQYGPCTIAGCGDGGTAADAIFGSGALHLWLDSLGNLYVSDLSAHAVRKIDVSGYASTIAGIDNPSQTPPATVPVPDGGPAVGTYLNAPEQLSFDAQDNLYIADGGTLVWKASPLQAQNIDFSAFDPATVTYGASPITLSATASSGLTLQYSVSSTPSGIGKLNGSQLQIEGAGQIIVTAAQPGNDVYLAATPVSQILTVNQASLTVTANPASKIYDTANPDFTATITGFVNGDTAGTPGVYTGAPAFTTTAVTNSSVGMYPITPSLGTLSSKSYNFAAFADGTLTVTGTQSQTISFLLGQSSVAYGHVPITLSATATSGGVVSFLLLSGPGQLSGANNSMLTITGAGTIVVEAVQEGYQQYQAATPVTHSLTVTPALLTVTGPSVALTYGTTINPASFPAAVITGFVAGDTTATTLTGSAQYTTVAGTPNAGTYPINVGLGTLTLLPAAAANYAFATTVNGTLTVNPAAQTINFNPISVSQTYGNQVQLTATASSGLTPVFTTTGPASFYNNINSLLVLNGVGTVTVTATQPGNGNYMAAPLLSQTFTVKPAPLNIQVNNVAREEGAPNPNFTYQIGCTQTGVSGCFVLSDGDTPSVITGLPTISTAATQSSPPGSYPITIAQGTLSAPNYSLVLINGTLTVTQPGSYVITANPSTLTIPQGQIGQATLTITPANYYQGTISLSCGSLPANVSCVFSPATYSFPGSQNPDGSENPAQGTLTINTSAAAVVSSVKTLDKGPRMAGFLLPGAFAALVLAWSRRRATRQMTLWRVRGLVVLGLGMVSLVSCGGSTGLETAASGTITITVNGSGTTPSGSGAVTASVPVTVTIQ